MKVLVIFKARILALSLLGLFVIASPAHLIAQEPAVTPKPVTPQSVVDEVTKDLLEIVKNGEQAMKDDPKKYFADVAKVMEPAVNFKYIAKRVMGKAYWPAATKKQQEAFVERFTSSLVQTYAKGMASFSGASIEVLPAKKEIPEYGRATVTQEIKSKNGVNRVVYTMGKAKGGQWQLINVVLNGVNLGVTFKSQFTQAVEESKGDIGAAIDSWALSV